MRPSVGSLLARSSKTAADSEEALSQAASGASFAAAAAASSLRGAATVLGQGLSAAFAVPVAVTSAAASVLPRADRAGRERELRACAPLRGKSLWRRPSPSRTHSPVTPHTTPPSAPHSDPTSPRNPRPPLPPVADPSRARSLPRTRPRRGHGWYRARRSRPGSRVCTHVDEPLRGRAQGGGRRAEGHSRAQCARRRARRQHCERAHRRRSHRGQDRVKGGSGSASCAEPHPLSAPVLRRETRQRRDRSVRCECDVFRKL